MLQSAHIILREKNYGRNQCSDMNKWAEPTHVLCSRPHMTHSESEWE